MVFLISLALALGLVFGCGTALRKHPGGFYAGAVCVSLTVVVCTFAGARFPEWFGTWVWPIFARGALAGAMFVLVMVAGAFPNGSKGAKLLMPIRGPLSIMACILTFGHNAAYGKTYFALLFTGPSQLPVTTLLAACCSVLMILLLLPLFVTSFTAVRRRMGWKRWKRLQRLAYIFYGLLCCHILLLTIPYALQGRAGYPLTVFVYGAVFLAYLICRVLKATGTRKKEDARRLSRRQLAGAAAALAVAGALALPLQGSVRATRQTTAETPAPVIATEPPAAAVPLPSEAPEKAVELSRQAEAPAQDVPLTEAETETAEQAETPPEARYRDGTYTGSGMGNLGTAEDISVSVTVADGRIDSIEITGFRDDPEYFLPEIEGAALIDAMLAAQSSEVDAVSGATYSSWGLMDAVAAALEKAAAGE